MSSKAFPIEALTHHFVIHPGTILTEDVLCGEMVAMLEAYLRGRSAVVGYVAMHWLPYLILPGPEGHISELFIDEKARGSGVGAKLLAEIRHEATKRGCSRLSLLNRRSRDSYQRGFYPKHGFEERTEMANFIMSL